MAVSTIDWAAIRQAYVTGEESNQGAISFSSFSVLCKRFGCSIDSLRKKSAKENWPKLRKEFQDQVYKKSTEAKLEQRTLNAQELNTLCVNTAGLMLKQIYDLAMEDPYTALKFSKNALECQKMARIALGLPVEGVATPQGVVIPDASLLALKDIVQGLSKNDLKGLVGDFGDNDGDE